MLATRNLQPMRLWHDDLDRWFSYPDRDDRWQPSVDVVEEKDQYVFRADVPGVELDQIEVVFDDGMLTISGERKSREESEKDGYRRIERSYGSFQRSFRLPDTIDADNISAKGDKGVLEVHVPKQEKAQRKIEIKG